MMQDEHEENLKLVLQCLREHKPYAKLSNCSFFQLEIHYLGHVITRDGIAVNPTKTGVILEWSALKNVHEVRCFIGLAGNICRRILKNWNPNYGVIEE